MPRSASAGQSLPNSSSECGSSFRLRGSACSPFSALVGLVLGLYSAIRASHKSPLAALRYGQALISNPHSGTHNGRLWVALLCGALGELSGDNVALEEHEKDNDWHDRDERTCQNESPITLHPPERTT